MFTLNSVADLVGNYFKLHLSRDQTKDFLPKLHLGEELEARVIKPMGDNRALIQLKGFEILAETGSPLSQGSNITVRVQQLTPRVIFNLLPQHANSVDTSACLLKTYLPNQSPLGEIIERLQGLLSEKWLTEDHGLNKPFYQNLKTVLSNIVFNQDKINNPEFLMNLITQSGLTYESKIRRLLSKGSMHESFGGQIDGDLKGLLLKILEGSNLRGGLIHSVFGGEGLSGEKIGLLMQAARDLVENIELTQITNSVTKQEGDYVYLQIPLAFQDGIDNAELYLFYDRKRKDNERNKEDFSLVFLLSMEEMGNIRIDVNVKKNDVYCRFTVKNEEIAQFINDLLPRLRDRLLSMGYGVEVMDCVVPEDMSQVEIGFGENFISESIRFVDVKV